MHSRVDLQRQLARIGVRPGMLLMPHVSLRAVGPTEARADGLLDALLESIAESGTLLMVLGADDSEPFDHRTTETDPEDMGVFVEIFRRRPGVKSSDHASARFGAIGPQADALLADPPLHDYYGPGSTLERFEQLGGQVLRLGANVDTVTLTHWAEYLADIPNKRGVNRRFVRADTGEQFIRCLDDTDGIVDWPKGDYFSQILIDFVSEGRARTGTVGDARAELLDGPSFVRFAVAWMERNLHDV